MSPLQTEAINVQNCFISRRTPKVYNLSLFLLYFSTAHITQETKMYARQTL